MKTRLFVLGFAALCFFSWGLRAEIVNVAVTYNKDLCDPKCMDFVAKTFAKTDEVADVSVSPGQILLKWKPEEKLTYQIVKRPMQRIGLSIDGIFVTVRGTARVSGQSATLKSLGDNTTFDLTSAPAPKGGQYVQYNNPVSYELLPDLREQLREAQKNRELVTISGFLLMPHRLPLTIVVSNINVQEEPEENE